MKSCTTVLKSFSLVIVVLSVVVTANNITYGIRGFNDRLLARDFVTKPSSWLSVQTETVQYPPKGHINYSILTAITLIDRGGSKNFGYSKLLKGGPNSRNATIYLKSQRGKALNFTIEYYSRW